MPESSSPYRPEYMPEELYCYGCYALVERAIQKLAGKTSESDIDDVLYKICPQKNWPYYKFKDFEIRSACDEITRQYLPELEKLL